MILVTGATGHVGANLVRGLLTRGQRVRVLVRSDTRALEGLEVERVRGDLTEPEQLRQAVRGCRQVYHAGAFVSLRQADKEKLHQVNVLGTRRLLEAAAEAGVERVVHCSSFGTIGTNPHGPSDESRTVDPARVAMPYEASKVLAEREVLRAVERGLHVTMVNPSGVVGPWDYKPSSVGQTILDFCHRKLPAYVPGAFDFVAVSDVVEGLLLAMEKGRPGERYILTGEVFRVVDVLCWLEELTGVPRPRLAIPPGLLARVAGIKDKLEERFLPHRAPRFTKGSIEILNSGKVGTSAKARRELGWEPSSVKEALRQQVTWFVDQGLLAERFRPPQAPSVQPAPPRNAVASPTQGAQTLA